MRTKRTPANADLWLWPKIDRSGGPDACWEWQGHRNHSDYGQVGYQGRPHFTHRLAAEFEIGPVAGAVVMHTCDNPACVRPDHLFIGTQADNVADAVRKGRARGAAGERNAKAKLTEHDVIQIRRLRDLGFYPDDIAECFGVKKSAVCSIGLRKSWRHVPEGAA